MHESASQTVSPARVKRVLLGGAAVLALIVVAGTASRIMAHRELANWTAAQAVPTVSVVHPKAATTSAIVLPGRIQAWAEAPVYARTAGYLRKWYADIGQHVSEGAVLADIDAPDLDQQLQAATAALATAEANRVLSQSLAERGDKLVKTGYMSQQDADQRHADLDAKTAMRNQARANVDQLKAMTGFKHIVAPFDGVVTSRSVDVGALIAAGATTPVPLFTVAETGKLRVYVNVPQSDAVLITPEVKAHFAVPEFPERTFDAAFASTADAVNAQGAMLVQLVVDNREGLLKPGGYAQVTLDIPKAANSAVKIPASALLFRREGLAVAVVGKDDTVSIRGVQLAQDDGAEVEVATGLSRDDRVIDSPSDAIANGDKVRVTIDDKGGKADAG